MNNFFARRSIILVVSLIAFVFATSMLYAGQSTIIVVEGKSCMGYDKSRKQTENEALSNAKRKAVEYASTYMKSESRMKDFEVEKDILDAYAKATVKVIEEIEKAWYKEAASGDCCKIKIKAEVIPDETAMTKVETSKSVIDDPEAPLNVQIWTDKKEYKKSEQIKIYIKGNKPFYARVLYKDVKGNILQLLPNKFRTDNYFNGGMVYVIPSGNDRFQLRVSPPFGEENIVVYSSLSPLGDIKLEDLGGVYEVKTEADDVGVKTRGITLEEAAEGKEAASAEFFEGKAIIRTKQQ